MKERLPMTPDQARAHLARLGLTQGDFTRLFDVDDRRARRWLSGELPIPRAVEIALTELTPTTAKKWLTGDSQPAPDIRKTKDGNIIVDYGAVLYLVKTDGAIVKMSGDGIEAAVATRKEAELVRNELKYRGMQA